MRQLKKFSGVGTVMIADLFNVSSDLELAAPEDILKAMKRCMDIAQRTVESHSGATIQFVGGCLMAFWDTSTDSAHAQSAFDASLAIVRAVDGVATESPVRFSMFIVLGTGELAGDFFGTTKQFQLVGKAMAVADRLSKFKSPAASLVRFSQYTADAIRMPSSVLEEGKIERAGLNDLKVYGYRPAIK